MKLRPTQFGVRENTASSRQHASRLRVEPHSNAVCIEEQSPDKQSLSSQSDLPAKGFDNPRHAASQPAASGGERGGSAEAVARALIRAQATEHYVNATEAAKFLSIHPRTLMQMARYGKIPAHPLGNGPRRVWRFLLSELDEWMRNRVHSDCRPCSPKRRET